VETAVARASTRNRPTCVISSGETTVHVTGEGKGGRNQEFALAAAAPLAELSMPAVIASAGTDGVDGPTDAAGALADSSTLERALARGIGPPDGFLANNDAYAFFAALGDLLITGPTDTNVGDLQVMLLGV
jgi:hydroxypyruvate reductase